MRLGVNCNMAMASVWENVRLSVLDEDGGVKSNHETPLKIELCGAIDKAHISLMNGESERGGAQRNPSEETKDFAPCPIGIAGGVRRGPSHFSRKPFSPCHWPALSFSRSLLVSRAAFDAVVGGDYEASGECCVCEFSIETLRLSQLCDLFNGPM